MRKIAVFKMFFVRVVTLYVLFCTVTPCPAQETARGIVAEKTGGITEERPDPEIRFFDTDYYNDVTVKAVSFDFTFIVVFDRLRVDYSNMDRYMIMDLKTGYKIREFVLNRNMDNTTGFVTISDDNKFMKILYNDEAYIYSVESGQQAFNIKQNFTGYISVDKDIEVPPFVDDKELYEIYKSNRNWARDDNSKLYYHTDYCLNENYTVIDATNKKIYGFSSLLTTKAYDKIYIYEDKSLEPQSVAAVYFYGHIVRYSMQGEVLNIYDYDSNDFIQKIEQQNELLFAYGNENIYVYDLYSGNLLKQQCCYNTFYDSDAYERYYNFEENYVIQISIACDYSIHKYSDFNGKIDLESEDGRSFPFDTDYSVFGYEDFVNLNNTVYFLTTDNN